jgi:hypothetical protein
LVNSVYYMMPVVHIISFLNKMEMGKNGVEGITSEGESEREKQIKE